MFKEKLSAIFESANTAILVFTPQQKIIFSNQATSQLFGYLSADMANVVVSDLFVSDSLPAIQAFIRNADSKKLNSLLIRVGGNHKNGQKLSLHLTLKKISGQQDTLYFIALIDANPVLTHLHHSALLLSMCQEMQNSLDILLTTTHLLLSNNPRPEQEAYLKVLESSGENIKKTVHHIFDFGEELSSVKTDFDFRKTIEDIRQSYKRLVKEKGGVFRLLIEEDIPQMMKGEPNNLRQILDQLVSGVFDLKPENSAFIHIYMHQETRQQYVLLFKVISESPYVANKQSGSLDQPSGEGTNEGDGHIGGKLTTVKNMAEMQGGHLETDKSEDKDIFYLYLPFAKSEQVNMSVAEAGTMLTSSKKQLLKGLKILYVDDVSPNQFLMEGLCHHWGVEFDSALNGLEALEKIQQNTYDLVLLDLIMPEMDGFEAASRIRNSSYKKYANIPILAVSASVSDHIQYKAGQVGINGFIPKPIDPDLLFNKIAQFAK